MISLGDINLREGDTAGETCSLPTWTTQCRVGILRNVRVAWYQGDGAEEVCEIILPDARRNRNNSPQQWHQDSVIHRDYPAPTPELTIFTSSQPKILQICGTVKPGNVQPIIFYECASFQHAKHISKIQQCLATQKDTLSLTGNSHRRPPIMQYC
jgi:hypothetical protein